MSRREQKYIKHATDFARELEALCTWYGMTIKAEERMDGSPELVFEHINFRIASAQEYSITNDLGLIEEEIEIFAIAE